MLWRKRRVSILVRTVYVPADQSFQHNLRSPMQVGCRASISLIKCLCDEHSYLEASFIYRSSSCFTVRQEAVRAHYRDGTLEFSTEADGSVGHLSFADFSANGRVLGKVNCTAGVNTDCAVYFYNATKEGILGLFGVPQSTLTGFG